MKKREYTELDHNAPSDCQDTCDRVVSIVCEKCLVRHVCHKGGNVNHEQLALCLESYVTVDWDCRPSTPEELTFRDDTGNTGHCIHCGKKCYMDDGGMYCPQHGAVETR